MEEKVFDLMTLIASAFVLFVLRLFGDFCPDCHPLKRAAVKSQLPYML